MKIMHIADLHLESKMESNLDKEKALLRKEELLETFSKAMAYAKENDIEVIMICGDLFDKPNIRKTAIRKVIGYIEEYPQIDFLYLRGNHDCGDFDEEIKSENAPKNLHLFSSEEWKSYSYGDVVISGREITDDNQKLLASSLILDPSKCNIVVLHGQESEYEGNDKTHKINMPAFNGKFIDYMALGHVHKYKQERLDERGIYCYPGCLEGRGFDECGDKGFVVLNIENAKLSTEFIPFAKRRLHEVEITVEEDMKMSELLDRAKTVLREYSKDDLIKVVLIGSTSMEQYIDISRLKREFDDCFFFFKIYDKTQVKIDYEDYINDRTLKGTFVRLMQKQEMSEERRADIIEIGIKAIMGEEIEE